MLRCYQQDVLHVAAARISWSHSITSVRLCNLSPGFIAKFHDHFNLGIEPMYMMRLVVFRIRDKSNSVEPNRTHSKRILRNRLEWLLHRLERLLQIRNQVVLVFDSDRQPHQPLRDAQRFALFIAKRGVRGGG